MYRTMLQPTEPLGHSSISTSLRAKLPYPLSSPHSCQSQIKLSYFINFATKTMPAEIPGGFSSLEPVSGALMTSMLLRVLNMALWVQLPLHCHTHTHSGKSVKGGFICIDNKPAGIFPYVRHRRMAVASKSRSLGYPVPHFGK